jgi:hypothetical protein
MNRELIPSQHSMEGGTEHELATSCVRGSGAVVVVINSDRCGVFGTYWDGTVLVAEACNAPNAHYSFSN